MLDWEKNVKVSLVVDKQQSQALGTQVYVMNQNSSAKAAEAIIREAVLLKASIEKFGKDRGGDPLAASLMKLGVPAPNKKTLSASYAFKADAFAELIVGPFYNLTKDSKKLVSVSASLVAGAPWQGYPQKSRTEALKLFAQFDNDTKNGGTSQGASAHWHKPFPFIHAGEGKNRVSLAQEHNIPYLAQVFTWEMVDANKLAVRKVGFSKHWVLQCSDKSQLKGDLPHPLRLADGEFLIPFPHLSVELFKQYGVQQKSRVFRFFINSRFKYHMLRFLREKCFGLSPWL